MRKIMLFLLGMMLIPALAWSVQVYQDGDANLNVGFWGQVWYQYVGDIDRDGDGQWDDDLNDFMARRAYLSIDGDVTKDLGFFVHFAGDRIGQEGLDNSGMGLGTGAALRDGWVNYKLMGNDLMVQAGRMYVPLTRNYGTTSTKALLTTELDWGQGGVRSGIFYPSKVGRDDGVTLWGNVVDDKLQYRLMVGEGEESGAVNPDDCLRFAGRLSMNLFDAETAWFNAGTYLGKKKILALGAGFDCQNDLVIAASKKNYSAYTVDAHLDIPVDEFALTAEAAYIHISNAISTLTWSDLTAGTDGDIVSLKAGILVAGNIQPFVHVETIMPDENDTEDMNVYGFGCNYYIKGPANKLTAEWTVADNDTEKVDIFTVQAAFGF